MQSNLCKDFYAKVTLQMSTDKSSGSSQSSIGPDALRAFAHPLRMAMYSALVQAGSATASQLARSLGESSGQTSYHLRQLERHGFVEDDPNHTGGRERWWRAVGFQMSDPALLHDPTTMGAASAVVREVIGERAAALTAWFEHLETPGDTKVAQLSASTLALTDAEATEMIGELAAMLDRYVKTAKARPEPDDARRFRVYLDVFPLAPVRTVGPS